MILACSGAAAAAGEWALRQARNLLGSTLSAHRQAEDHELIPATISVGEVPALAFVA